MREIEEDQKQKIEERKEGKREQKEGRKKGKKKPERRKNDVHVKIEREPIKERR